MNKLLAVLLASVFVGGCFNEKAPEINNPDSIVIDGTKYTATEYLNKFCMFKDSEHDKNCKIAARQQRMDRARR